MKKVGLIGGIGPASTVDYYMGIIDGYREKTGDAHYPEVIVYSIDMTEMIASIEENRLDKTADQLSQAVSVLHTAGAEIIAMASNTPHLVYNEIRSPVPMVSIIEATCKAIQKMCFRRVLVIGTLFTMRSGLYTTPLKSLGVSALLPTKEEQEEIFALFFPNLENGIVVAEDKEKMLSLLRWIIKEQNADSLLLACTELPLMIRQEDMSVPVIDTAKLHIEAIVKAMITEKQD